jgi:hypothetical protein
MNARKFTLSCLAPVPAGRNRPPPWLLIGMARQPGKHGSMQSGFFTVRRKNRRSPLFVKHGKLLSTSGRRRQPSPALPHRCRIGAIMIIRPSRRPEESRGSGPVQEARVMVPAFPHVLISSFLETSRRQIVASVTVRFSGGSSEILRPDTRTPEPLRTEAFASINSKRVDFVIIDASGRGAGLGPLSGRDRFHPRCRQEGGPAPRRSALARGDARDAIG